MRKDRRRETHREREGRWRTGVVVVVVVALLFFLKRLPPAAAALRFVGGASFDLAFDVAFDLAFATALAFAAAVVPVVIPALRVDCGAIILYYICLKLFFI